MTARPKIHGGYTLNRETGKAVYWTCRHEIYVEVKKWPAIECPTCAAMGDDALADHVKNKNIEVAE